MTERFPAHGDFRVSVEGPLVITEITGPWNAQLLQRWVIALEPHSKQARLHGRYGGITIIHGSVLCPPDALSIMRERTQWSVQRHPYVGTAFVVAPGVEGSALTLSVFGRVFQGLCAFQVFPELPAAKAWLTEQIRRAGAAQQGDVGQGGGVQA